MKSGDAVVLTVMLNVNGFGKWLMKAKVTCCIIDREHGFNVMQTLLPFNVYVGKCEIDVSSLERRSWCHSLDL